MGLTNQNAREQQPPADCRAVVHTSTRADRVAGSSRRTRSVPEATGAEARFVSVKTLAKQWDCSRTTVCRLLEQAGVPAFFLGQGRNGTKRYLKADVDAFLHSIEHC